MRIQETGKPSYKGLKVYEKSYSLALEIYSETKNMPKEEMYGLTSQIRRSAMSIPSTIAEGYGKKEHAAEYKRFLLMARGSCNEVRVWIDFCADLGYMSREKQNSLQNSYEEVSKMIYGLIVSVSGDQNPPASG